MEIRFPDVLARLVLGARGLGLVFVVYFLPVLARDVAGLSIPGANWFDLTRVSPGPPWLALAVVTVTFALSAAVVLLYTRAGGAVAVQPTPLLRADRAWFADWGRGVLLGGLCATVAVVPALLAGALRIQGVRPVERPDVLVALGLVLVLEAGREELGFRGPSQRDLTAAGGFPLAAVFLAGSFTVVHAGNPDVGRSGLVGIFLAAIALAGLVRARGDVAMACGLHAGWNVFLGLVWSVPVSGVPLAPALLDVQSSGPSFWTGGSFGAEAGAPGLVVLAVLGLVTWMLPARSGPNGEGETRRA
jgi:membrane protease YdiL (CAAX protease family)